MRYLLLTFFFLPLSLVAYEQEQKNYLSLELLKNKEVNLSIIDQVESFLLNLKKVDFRPKSCPMKQNSNDLLESLLSMKESLVDSRCKEYKSGYLEKLTLSLMELKKAKAFNLSGDSNKEYDSVFYEQELSYKNLHNVMSAVSGLVQDANCASDIKDRGFLSVVSDIIGTIASLSIVTSQGAIKSFGVLGLASSSLMSAIYGLLKSKFNMNEPKDRENFIRLSCNFYDVHSKITNNNFLHIPNKKDRENLWFAQNYSQIIADKISILEREQKSILSSAANLNMADRAFIVKEVNIAFKPLIKELSSLLNRLKQAQSTLQSIVNNNNFVDWDEGTYITHTTLQKIKEIEQILYGYEGWNFLNYTNKEASAELRKFYYNFIRFKDKFLLSPGIYSGAVRSFACATANDIILSINNSRSLINMATDYISTNKYIFHANVNKLKLFSGFLSSDTNSKKHILRQTYQFYQAKDLLKYEVYIFPSVIISDSIFFKPELGDLMIGQSVAEKKLPLLYEFMANNRCNH